MTLREVFAALGGQSRVAERLGVLPTAVSNWAVANRLPPAHHIPLWRMALEAGLSWEPPGAADLRPLLCQRPLPVRPEASQA